MASLAIRSCQRNSSLWSNSVKPFSFVNTHKPRIAIARVRVTQPLLMRPVEIRRSGPAGTQSTLFSADKPDCLFTVMTFLIDKISGVALDLKTGVPCYQVEDEEGRIHILLHLPIEEEHEHRWCLWRPDHAGFDSRSIFEGALLEQ